MLKTFYLSPVKPVIEPAIFISRTISRMAQFYQYEKIKAKSGSKKFVFVPEGEASTVDKHQYRDIQKQEAGKP